MVVRKRAISNLRDRKTQPAFKTPPSQSHTTISDPPQEGGGAIATKSQSRAPRLRGGLGPLPQPLPHQIPTPPPGTPVKLERTPRAASLATTDRPAPNPVPSQKPKSDVKVEGRLRSPAASLTVSRSSNKSAAVGPKNHQTTEILPESRQEPHKSACLAADEAEKPHEPAPLPPLIPFLESEELTRELLHGPLSFDNIHRLGLKVKKLAKNHNLSAESAEFLKQFDENGSDATTLTPEIGQDEEVPSPLSSPNSVFTHTFSDVVWPDHVDFRSSYVSLAADALDTPTPQPEISPNVSKTEPHLHKKKTIGQISDAYESLEEIETALNAAHSIKETARKICESLEAEMNVRIDSAEALLIQKGLAEPSGTSPSGLPQSVSDPSVPSATFVGEPSLQKSKRRGPSPPDSSGKNCMAAAVSLKDSDQEDDIIKHIRDERSMGNLRWQEANRNGEAKLWLVQAGLNPLARGRGN